MNTLKDTAETNYSLLASDIIRDNLLYEVRKKLYNTFDDKAWTSLKNTAASFVKNALTKVENENADIAKIKTEEELDTYLKNHSTLNKAYDANFNLGKNAAQKAFNNENSMIINMCKDSADVFKNEADKKNIIEDDKKFILDDRQAKMNAFEFEIKKAALASAIQAEKNKEEEDSKRKEAEEKKARERKEAEEEKARIKKEAKQEAVRVKEAKAANEAQNKITNIEMQLAKDWALNANGASTLQPVKQEEEKEQPKPLSSVGVSVAEVTDKKDLSAAGQQLDSVYEQNNRILEADKANYQKELNKAETALNEKINEFLNYDFNINKLKKSEVSNESRILFIDKTFKEHPDEFSNLNREEFNKIKHLEQLAKNCRDDVDKQKNRSTLKKQKSRMPMRRPVITKVRF